MGVTSWLNASEARTQELKLQDLLLPTLQWLKPFSEVTRQHPSINIKSTNRGEKREENETLSKKIYNQLILTLDYPPFSSKVILYSSITKVKEAD